MFTSRIIGCGHCFPKKIVTNDDLAKIVDTNDEWIFSRTGIKERRIAGANESTASLGAEAAMMALRAAGERPEDVEAIILATTTPDHPMPATATKIQAMIGASRAFAFDVQAVCSGFIYALSIADGLIRGLGKRGSVLVIGAEVMSRVVDWKDRSTCVLFGDGAGAVLLKGSEERADGGRCGILSTHLFSDGTFYDSLFVDRESSAPEGRGAIESADRESSAPNNHGTIKMNGRTVFTIAIEKMTEVAALALAENSLSINDIDWLVVHQANKRIIDVVVERLGIYQVTERIDGRRHVAQAPSCTQRTAQAEQRIDEPANFRGLDTEKVIVTLESFANTGAATIPTTLSIAHNDGRLKAGDLILMVAMGGGFTWGAAVVRL
ncbi:MAG: ketoacyl-ACP synthase III [Holosporales bacterium]|nr:ketoacyl-ACP synthase III [Holosporales bacterium]